MKTHNQQNQNEINAQAQEIGAAKTSRTPPGMPVSLVDMAFKACSLVEGST